MVAVMNAFFIPRLGTQIYAMPGMVTKLNLIANHEGEARINRPYYNVDSPPQACTAFPLMYWKMVINLAPILQQLKTKHKQLILLNKKYVQLIVLFHR